MSETKNIYQKLLAIATEIETVAKNLEVGTGSFSYKAVGEADVLRAIKPLEKKYGIYSYPAERKIIESGVIENENIDNKTHEKVIKRNLYERIETTYRFVNTENPQEYIDIVSYGDGIDSQDKSVGKAMTYADKYALMKAYKIVTGDDPDQQPSAPLQSVKITLDKKLLQEAEELGINLDNLAKYYKTTKDLLTNDNVKKAIELKRNAIKKNANIQ